MVSAADEAEVQILIDEHFRELTELVKGLAVLGELTPRSIDAVASYGERLSSHIVALALRNFEIETAHLDSRRVIVTDRRHTQAAPLYPETYSRLAQTIPPLLRWQCGGHGWLHRRYRRRRHHYPRPWRLRFHRRHRGSRNRAPRKSRSGPTWTACSPPIPAPSRAAHRLKTISFAEAAELAYFGAKVLHPATVLPAIEKSIPVLILNSRRPEAPGTRIVAERVPCQNPIKSIACKRDITVVNIHSTRMLMAHGFLHRIFEVFDRYETPVDMLATSEVSVSLTIDNTARLQEICVELRQFAEVSVEENQAIVCLVGDNLRDRPGVAARVFGALSHLNVRLISLGGSRLNLSLVVTHEDLEDAVKSLHAEFFQQLDPEVFD